MYKLVLTAGLFLFSGNALAAYTEAKACDTCDYDDAVRLAKTYYKKLNCQISGLNGNNIEFGATTYQCNDTSKEIIITNALTQTAYKFNVSATQQSPYSSAARVTTTNMSTNAIEREALAEFYEIDSQFRRAVINAGNIVTPRSSSSSLQSYNLKGFNNSALSSASSGGSESCSNHPSIYLTSSSAQTRIENEIRQQITDEIGDKSWHDFFEDTDFTGGSIQLGKGSIGISLSLDNDRIGAFSTKVYGEDPYNLLNFKVTYEGEVEIRGKRNLHLNLSLSRGSSLVDGIQIGTFMSGTDVDLTDGVVSNCLLENLGKIAGAQIEIRTDSGGGATGPGFGDVDFPISIGGSCTREVKYNICSTSNGVRSCNDNSVTTSC